ncbi:hypothetical protein [Phenylobacterium sp.]|uniref:hypothetical protein n=1 Tax=Phenylobacterium sp. TaxID=1871053 RepID=UPI0035B4299E
MSEHEDWDDVLPNEPNGEVVHWMEPRPMSVGPAGISMAAAGAFALGALTTVAVLAMMHWLKPERRVTLPNLRRWRSSIH